MRSVKDEVDTMGYIRLKGQVGDRIRDPVLSRAWDQVGGRVWGRVWFPVQGPTEDQVRDHA